MPDVDLRGCDSHFVTCALTPKLTELLDTWKSTTVYVGLFTQMFKTCSCIQLVNFKPKHMVIVRAFSVCALKIWNTIPYYYVENKHS